MIETWITRSGEAFLLEQPCWACNRVAGSLMCELCEKLTVAEMFPAVRAEAEPSKPA